MNRNDRGFSSISLGEARARQKRRGMAAGADAANKGAMAAVRATHGDSGPATKASGIKALMAAGDMRGAILAAARLPELDKHRAAILGAKEAIVNPGFQRQLHRDPDALIAAGVAALRERFP